MEHSQKTTAIMTINLMKLEENGHYAIQFRVCAYMYTPPRPSQPYFHATI